MTDEDHVQRHLHGGASLVLTGRRDIDCGRPEWFSACVAGSLRRMAVAAALAAAVVGIPSSTNAATPIAGGGATSLPAFQGARATPKPIRRVPLPPRHPFMARNGNSNVHNDAWMTDAYTRRGPLGRSPTVFSTALNRVCITLTFDRRGRLVASCISPATGPRLFMLDPRTLDTLAEYPLPYVPPPPGIPVTTNTAGGAYFYLDNRDQAVIATANGRIWVVRETGGRTRPGFRRVRDWNITPHLAPDERVPSALPDWRGRIWFVGRQNGTVGVLNRRTGRVRKIRLNEEIENSFAVSREGVYIATDRAMYRFNTRRGRPRVTWRARYRNSGVTKPGQFNAGTGTTPTVMGRGYVTITDNADPMNVVVFRRRARLRRGQRRKVCQVPVFRRGASATENSLIVAGRAIIVENNYGYVLGQTANGRLSEPGIARVDVRLGGRGCKLRWWNRTERAPSVVPKLSLATGLVYLYTKDPDPGNLDSWFWTALDFRTGKTVWKRLAGTGSLYNNHYAGIALGPDRRTAYLGGVGGVMAVRDSP
jgi:hypothetical protein